MYEDSNALQSVAATNIHTLDSILQSCDIVCLAFTTITPETLVPFKCILSKEASFLFIGRSNTLDILSR